MLWFHWRTECRESRYQDSITEGKHIALSSWIGYLLHTVICSTIWLTMYSLSEIGRIAAHKDLLENPFLIQAPGFFISHRFSFLFATLETAFIVASSLAGRLQAPVSAAETYQYTSCIVLSHYCLWLVYFFFIWRHERIAQLKHFSHLYSFTDVCDFARAIAVTGTQWERQMGLVKTRINRTRKQSALDAFSRK